MAVLKPAPRLLGLVGEEAGSFPAPHQTDEPPRRWKWTGDDLIHLGEAGFLPPEGRFELLDGEIFELMPPNPPHASDVDVIGFLLDAEFGPRGAHARIEKPIRLRNVYQPQPDVAAGERRSSVEEYRRRQPTPDSILASPATMSLRARIPIIILLMLALAGLPRVAPAAMAGESWPMFGGNAAHSGYVPVTFGAHPVFSELWMPSQANSIQSLATEWHQEVFVSLEDPSTSNQLLTAFDSRTRRLIWSQPIALAGAPTTPAVANGIVYVNDAADGFLRAFDAPTGQPLFASPLVPGHTNLLSPTVYDNTVFVGESGSGNLYAFEAVTGQQLWFAALPPYGPYGSWTPAVDASYVYAYLGAGGKSPTSLYALDRSTGDQVFQVADPGGAVGAQDDYLAPVIGNSSDVLVIQNGRLVCFDTLLRSIRWQSAAGYVGLPALRNGVVYAAAANGLSALAETDGELLWSWETPTSGALDGAVLVTNDHVLASTGPPFPGSAGTYVISLKSHHPDADIGATGAQIAFGDGLLYLGGFGFGLTAVQQGAPRMEAAHTLGFGRVGIGEVRTSKLVIANQGDAPLNVLSVSVTTPPPPPGSPGDTFLYSGPPLPAFIPPGSSRAFPFTFSPGLSGAAEFFVTIATNENQDFSVHLTGSGISLR